MVFSLEMMCLQDLLRQQHRCGTFISAWGFSRADSTLALLQSQNLHVAFRLLRLLRCLYILFPDDLSDRNLER